MRLFRIAIPILEHCFMATLTKRRLLSLDGWAVVLSLAVALLVRFGILKTIPW
jgi:hypothetical protein